MRRLKDNINVHLFSCSTSQLTLMENQRLSVAWLIARELGYSIAAIKHVTQGDEVIRAKTLIERLLDLIESLEKEGQDTNWINDFTPVSAITHPLSMSGHNDGEISPVSNELNRINQSTAAESVLPQRQALIKETFELMKGVYCYVCYQRPMQILSINCTHLVACKDCLPKLKKCPICKTSIDDYIQIYLS